MAKHIALLSCLLVVASGCEERITAPGACPEYCKETSFEVRDSVMVDAVVRDSSFRGYVFSHRASLVQAIADSAGTESRAVLDFIRFLPEVPLFVGDTQLGAVTQVDSFVIQLSVARRMPGSTGATLRLHRTPAGFDSATTFAELDDFFDDSTLIGEVALPDSLETGDVSLTVPPSAFPDFSQDSLRVAFGVEVGGSDPDFVSLGARGASPLATVSRYFKVDSSGTTVERNDARSSAFARTIADRVFTEDTDELTVGGLPSSRIVIRIAGIEDILTNSSIIRATVQLTPTTPVVAAPGDSLRIQANPVGVDFGKKSPVLATQIDSLQRGTATVAAGSSAPVEIDVTQMLTAWAANDDLPRTMVISAFPEATSIAEATFYSSRGNLVPVLRLTFVPPLGLSN